MRVKTTDKVDTICHLRHAIDVNTSDILNVQLINRILHAKFNK